MGGGRLLVRKGEPIFHANEFFDPRALNSQQPRGAMGQLADGRLLLVSIEGTNPAYSIGMSSYELAVELSRLGAVTAFGLGSGPPSGLAVDGEPLPRPASGHQGNTSDAPVPPLTRGS